MDSILTKIAPNSGADCKNLLKKFIYVTIALISISSLVTYAITNQFSYDNGYDAAQNLYYNRGYYDGNSTGYNTGYGNGYFNGNYTGFLNGNYTGYYNGYQMGQNDAYQNNTPYYTTQFITPLINGIIDPREWRHGDYYMMPYYAPSTMANTGFHYVNIAQDSDNIYLSADLVAYTDDDYQHNWFGTYLTMNQPSFATKSEWSGHNDVTTEAVLFNLWSRDVYTKFWSGGNTRPTASFQLYEDYVTLSMEEGTIEDDPSNTWDKTYVKNNNPSDPANTGFDTYPAMNTTIDGMRESLLITFDIQQYYEDNVANVTADMLNDIENIRVDFGVYVNEHTEFLQFFCNPVGVTGTQYFHAGDPEESHTYFEFSITLDAVSILEHTISFRIIVDDVGLDLTNFSTYLDYIRLSYDPNEWVDRNYGVSTIEEASVETYFGSSSNYAVPHLQIEISIPKEELQGYTNNCTLGLFFQGGYDAPDDLWQFPGYVERQRAYPNYWLGSMNSQNGEYYHSTNYYYYPMGLNRTLAY